MYKVVWYRKKLPRREACEGGEGKLGIRVLCLSDTHGQHRSLSVLPEADILIHAGDFTRFSNESHLDDFNDWLGEIRPRFQHILVVNGNHEHNSPWKKETAARLSNATFLLDSSTQIDVRTSEGRSQTLVIHGTNFFWPMTTPNPHYDAIEENTDIIVSHGPCKGFVDEGSGCETLLSHVRRIRPRLVVSGHMHGGHGQVEDGGVVFVNAANCRNGYKIGWDAIVANI